MNESSLSDAALAELLTLTVTVNSQGTTMYRNHLGQIHRIHGPAIIISDGGNSWWLNGKRHRTDGPSVVWSSGDVKWFLNGRELTEKEFNEQIRSL